MILRVFPSPNDSVIPRPGGLALWRGRAVRRGSPAAGCAACPGSHLPSDASHPFVTLGFVVLCWLLPLAEIRNTLEVSFPKLSIMVKLQLLSLTLHCQYCLSSISMFSSGRLIQCLILLFACIRYINLSSTCTKFNIKLKIIYSTFYYYFFFPHGK